MKAERIALLLSLSACASTEAVPCPTGFVEDSTNVCRLGCDVDDECLPHEECSGAGLCVPRLDGGSPTISRFTAPESASIGEVITIDYVVLFAESVELSEIDASGRRTFYTSNALAETTPYTFHGTVTLRIEAILGSVRVPREIQVTTAGVDAVRIDSFAASPSLVDPGDPVDLTWSIANGDGRIELSASTVGPLVPDAPGFARVSPLETTTYTLTAYGADGSVASESASVEVRTPIDAPTVSFEIRRPTSVRALDNLVFKWTTTNALGIELVNLTGASPIYATNDPITAANGRWLGAMPPGGAQSFQIRAVGAGGLMATQTIQIAPVPRAPLPAFRDVVVEPRIGADAAQRVTLTWVVDPPNTPVTLREAGTNAILTPNMPSGYFTTGGATRRFVLTAENETGVAEARASAWAIVAQANPPAGQVAQPIDGFAVAGSMGSQSGGPITPFEEAFYSVQVPAGGFLTVSLEPSCALVMQLDVEDEAGMFSASSSGTLGVCPAPVRIGPVEGTVQIKVTGFEPIGLVQYQLVAEPEGPICGDAIQAESEACESMNRLHDDACDGYCRLTPSYNYAVSEGTRPSSLQTAPLDLTLMPPTPGADVSTDGVAVVELPFELAFYGHRYVGVMAHVDGYVTLYPDGRQNDLFRPNAPNGVISAFAADLQFTPPGGLTASLLTLGGQSAVAIHYQGLGTAIGGATVNGTVVIDDAGAIILDYAELSGARRVEAGVQDASGQATFFVPGCGGATSDPPGSCPINQLPANRLIQFLPAGHAGFR